MAAELRVSPGDGPAEAARICCLDLDTFFVSVERLLEPCLLGKPVVVGGARGQRGVVTAASYEVRAFGVHSGMSLTKASELAPPETVFLPGRHGVYSDYARQVREIAARFSPELQVASIDEMFIDFRGCERMHRLPADESDDATILRTVRALTAAIADETGLPASCGIATSKTVSKVASNLAKPAGVLLVPAGTERALLAPLPVRKLPGIGPVAEGKLHAAGIETLAQVAAASPTLLRTIFGAWHRRVRLAAAGFASADLGRERPAFREHDPVGEVVGSISNERTFREDVADPSQIESMLCSLCERVTWRARKRGVKARTVTLKLRYADFHTISRARTITPTCSELELFPVVRDLYTRARTRRLRIRLLGLCLSKLGFFDEQLELFPGDEVINQVVDDIRERYGFDAVGVATARSRAGRSATSRGDATPRAAPDGGGRGRSE